MTAHVALDPPRVGNDWPRGACDDAPRSGVSLDVMDDADVVSRALAGDPDAFAILVDRHAAVCLRYATRMLGSRDDAEDVLQDSLMRAFRALPAYDRARDFRTWLLSIVANRCRTALATRRRRDRFLVADGAERAAVAIAGADADSDEIGAVQWALAKLDATHREAFLLKHVEGLSYEEIASVTGAGISALKMRVRRACERMRDLLEDEDARSNA
jgi:RNA polymerase sigma-70 factor (ECF subfamily)